MSKLTIFLVLLGILGCLMPTANAARQSLGKLRNQLLLCQIDSRYCGGLVAHDEIEKPDAKLEAAEEKVTEKNLGDEGNDDRNEKEIEDNDDKDDEEDEEDINKEYNEIIEARARRRKNNNFRRNNAGRRRRGAKRGGLNRFNRRGALPKSRRNRKNNNRIRRIVG